MQHDPYFSLAHPVTPLADCSPHIQAMFGYKPKQPAVTRDGHLQCQCTRDRSNCTCRPTTDAAQAPEAFRWTAGTGMVSLGTLPGQSVTEAFGVSADGSVVVGYDGFWRLRE